MTDQAEPENLLDSVTDSPGQEGAATDMPDRGPSGGSAEREGHEKGADLPDHDHPEGPPDKREGDEKEGDKAPAMEDRPDWLPEKFWDPEGKQPRMEEMAKSYRELEQHLSNKGYTPPEEYKLELPEGVDELHEDDEKFFRQAGFTNDQAQQAVQYLYDEVVPQMREAFVKAEAADLEKEWAMDKSSEDFKHRMAKIRDFAYQNFPKEVVDHLAKSASGVKQLWTAMEAGYHGDVGPGAASQKKTKAELESMMRDERYETDPAYQKYVEEEFKKVFG